MSNNPSLKIEAYGTSSSLVPSSISNTDNLETLVIKLIISEWSESQSYEPDTYSILQGQIFDIYNNLNNEYVGGTVEFSQNTIVNVSIDDLLDSGIYPANTEITLKATFKNPIPTNGINIQRYKGFPASILTFRLLIRRK